MLPSSKLLEVCINWNYKAIQVYILFWMLTESLSTHSVPMDGEFCVSFDLQPSHWFHLVYVWRGSSRLNEIRDFTRVQFPPGLRILQVPLRAWPDATTPWLWAFDRYSLTITYVGNCLESKRLCLVTLPIWNECRIILTHSPALCVF